MAIRRPILAEPDHRYLRRRANRRVRKQRLTRNLFRFMMVATVNAIIASIVIYAAFRGVDHFLRSDEFALERIELRGVEHGSAEALHTRLAPFNGRNLFYLSLDDIEHTLQRDPWVREASVKRMLPRAMRISITEREPVAWVLLHGVPHMIDETGFAIGPADTASDTNLPVITGVDGLPREQLLERIRMGVSLVERLNRTSPVFAAQVSELDLSSRDRVVARTSDGGPPLLLDPEQVERNVNTYLGLRSEIAHRVGPARYVDLRWRDRIAVMPNSKNRFQEGT
ncbi:MAG: FtsQ-type POTRA domain-containing protein [Acidobacteriota bacterium]|nr:FtsQ-type POTRA domain-containing protein [Acidobacteriota bacterium]MDH3784312.1 FtsQ-type POTRA domain-containing protein [Acidobacteriota bacterium]